MTGVLYAKVGGTWVPVGGGGGDEVWVGPDDPGINSPHEIWYDTDDDGPQYGNYAQGVTNLGAFNFATGTAMPAAGGANTTVATVTNFYYVSGRRYRLLLELNAVTAAAADVNGTAAGWFGLRVDGVDQGGGVHFQTHLPSGSHSNFRYEWYLEKYGMSAGLHQLQLFWSPNVGQVTIYNDVGTCEIRDVGPSNPMNPATQTTPAPWLPMPFKTGWQNYGAPFNLGGYRRLGDTVTLRGLITQVGGAGGTMLQIPTGYRPSGQIIQAQLTSLGMSRYDILTDGNMTTSTTIQAGNWVCLDGIQYSVTGG